jgi:hypothetical protein
VSLKLTFFFLCFDQLEVKSNAILIQRAKIDFAPDSNQARRFTFA